MAVIGITDYCGGMTAGVDAIRAAIIGSDAPALDDCGQPAALPLRSPA